MKRRKLRLVAVLLTVVLVMGTFVTPVAAGQGNGRGNGRGQASVPVQKIHPLDAEIRVINGQPVFVYETKEGYEKIPFSLPKYAYADGQRMPLQTQGNNVLVPTEEGLVAVPLQEFDVTIDLATPDGEIVLMVEEGDTVMRVGLITNPVPAIFIVIARVLRALGWLAVTAYGLHLMWTQGVCLSPACLAPTPDGSRGDLFCGHPQCPATITSLLSWFGP